MAHGLAETVLDPTSVLDLWVRDIADFRATTRYCVTPETHEENVRAAVAQGYPSISVSTEATDEPLAIVCSGPSLQETWPELKQFAKIMAVSGAHDFLVEHGIIPTWALETDPRPHKAAFHQHPHADVQYLIASCCHPSVFEALAGHDIRLWHVLDSGDPRLLPVRYPRGHWLLSGGSNAGLRALVMARLLGFTTMHIFGMDCSAGPETFHVNAHPNEPKAKGHRTVTVGEQTFRTTEVFLEYARQFFHETTRLPDVTFTLHGNGLLQYLAARNAAVPTATARRLADARALEGTMAMVAIAIPPVISDSHTALMRKMVEECLWIWNGGLLAVVESLIRRLTPRTILDYGSGTGHLVTRLSVPAWEYDPAVPGKDLPPRPADLVLCLDVLPCVEPEYLDAVLADLSRCTLGVTYLVIETGPSAVTLPDGRNAHLIQEGAAWWRERLAPYFTVPEHAVMPRGTALHIVLGRQGKEV